eukprot:2889584-Amphidinium_carterae.1
MLVVVLVWLAEGRSYERCLLKFLLSRRRKIPSGTIAIVFSANVGLNVSALVALTKDHAWAMYRLGSHKYTIIAALCAMTAVQTKSCRKCLQ